MVAPQDTDVNSDADVVDNSSPPPLGCSSSVPCSICFDLVIDDGERSTAKLHCGHKFHLDCIGSAFNTKGTMQCPNCRKVEKGRWLFADGSAHAVSEIGEQDWMPNEDPHELSHSGRPFGFHWCPFGGLTVHSSFEEVDSSSSTFANFQGNLAMITEHTDAPTLARSYISYVQPSEHASNSNFHHPLNALSARRHNLHPANIQHPSWIWNCHFPAYNADIDYIDHGDLASVHPATLRSTQTQAQAQAQADAIARSPSFLHPLHYTQRSVSRTGEGSVPVPFMSYHLEQPSEITNMPSSTNLGFRRFGVARGLPMVLPAVSGQPDHRGGFYVREAGSPYNSAHERDHSSHFPTIWGSFHPCFSRGPDSSDRTHWS